MTSYGEGCPAVEVFCKGERAEMAFSGEGERAPVAASGESGLAGEAVSCEGVFGAEAVSGEGVLISGKSGSAAEALSGEGGGAVVVSGKGPPLPVSGEGGLAAEALSGDGGGAVAASGKGKRKRKRDLLSSLDYPCTDRLRLRRLLAYLREYWCATYDVAKESMLVIFHTEDLMDKVKAGLWQEAFQYVRKFAPVMQSSKEADYLSLFLRDLMAISGFADGDTWRAGIVCDFFTRIYRDPVLDKYPFFATVVADVLFLRAQHLRSSLDWQLVRNKAAEMVEEMANNTPELKDAMRYPRGQNDLYDIMPFRPSFRQRRQVKNLGRKQSTEVALFYLELKKRLPSSSQLETHADSAGSGRCDEEIMISLLDKALHAGRQMVYKLGHPSQYLSKEVFPLEAALTVKAIPDPFIKQGLEYATKQVLPLEAALTVSPFSKQGQEYATKQVLPMEAALTVKAIPDPFSKQGQEYATKQDMMPWRFHEAQLIRAMNERGIGLSM